MEPCFYCGRPCPERSDGLPAAHFHCDIAATLDAYGYGALVIHPEDL